MRNLTYTFSSLLSWSHVLNQIQMEGLDVEKGFTYLLPIKFWPWFSIIYLHKFFYIQNLEFATKVLEDTFRNLSLIMVLMKEENQNI